MGSDFESSWAMLRSCHRALIGFGHPLSELQCIILDTAIESSKHL